MDLKALYKISYGMYAVSSVKNGKFNGQIANAVIQAASSPAQVIVCVNKENLTHEYINESGVFTVSVLEETTPMEFIGNFGFRSGREFDKFKGIEYKKGKTGAPVVLENSLSYFECEVTGKMPFPTHTAFAGRVVEAQHLKEGKPMTYAYYHEIKNGKSPKAAPTYVEEKIKETEDGMEKYVCDVCGYVYDPEKGDFDSGIEQGTSFENLPDDWVCPVCGAGKDQFSEVK